MYTLQDKIAELQSLLGNESRDALYMFEAPSFLQDVPTRLDYHTNAPLDLLNAELESGIRRNSTTTISGSTTANDCRHAISAVI